MNNHKIILLAISSIFLSYANAASTENTKASANLNSQAKLKVQKAKVNLDALLTNNSNDLIVEIAQPNIAARSAVDKRIAIADYKTSFKRQYQTAKGLTVLRDYNALPITIYRINNKETLVKLLNDPQVKAIYPNLINKKFKDAESLPLINQPQAYANGFDGSGASVVIADSGVDYRHNEFGSCTGEGLPSTCRVVRNFDTAANDNSLDDDGHGTNVAGIVANTGPKLKLIGIDVFDGEGAYDSDIIAAINWSINNASTYNIKAINLSLGVPGVKYTSECQTAYTQVFANARAAGVVPVIAAGNDGFKDGVSLPACNAGVVRVGAVYDSNLGRLAWRNCTDASTAADQPTCFSNGGRLLTVFAPGALIEAAGIVQGGTSQASPHVAGVIGVLRANNVTPLETIDQTILRLQNTGKPIRDYRNGVTTSRIDLLAASSGLAIKK